MRLKKIIKFIEILLSIYVLYILGQWIFQVPEEYGDCELRCFPKGRKSLENIVHKELYFLKDLKSLKIK